MRGTRNKRSICYLDYSIGLTTSVDMQTCIINIQPQKHLRLMLAGPALRGGRGGGCPGPPSCRGPHPGLRTLASLG